MNENVRFDLIALLGALFIFLVILISKVGYGMDFGLFGHKTVSIFDLWSIQHLITGFLAGFVLLKIKNNKITILTFSIIVLISAYGWEILEWFMEMGYIGLWLGHWETGAEFWMNKLIADPVLVLVGALIYRRYRFSIVVPVALTILWLLLNLLAPDAMFFQEAVLTLK